MLALPDQQFHHTTPHHPPQIMIFVIVMKGKQLVCLVSLYLYKLLGSNVLTEP